MSGLIRPGAHPPLLIPYCSRCEQPAEEIKFDVVSSPFYVAIQASCCGYTGGARLPIDEVFRLQRSKEKFFMLGAGRKPQWRDPINFRRRTSG